MCEIRIAKAIAKSGITSRRGAEKLIEEDGGLLSFLFEFTEWSHVLEKINKTKTDQLLADFLGEEKPENWMENSHQSVQTLFNQSYRQFDQLRKKLIAIITGTSL